MTSRKPTFVRWAEEAEAKQVCEWAGLEQARDRSDVDTERVGRASDCPSFAGCAASSEAKPRRLSETVNN